MWECNHSQLLYKFVLIMHIKANKKTVYIFDGKSSSRKEKLFGYSGKQVKILIISKTYKSRYLTKILLFVMSYLL